MHRKSVLMVASVILLVCVVGVTLKVEKAKAVEIIYIRADGSIEPVGVSILSSDNMTYTFTDDIEGSVVIQRDNVVIDGGGYNLRGTGDYETYGLTLNGRDNVTVKNLKISLFDFGFNLSGSSKIVIVGNSIAQSLHEGIRIGYSSNNNTVTGNDIKGGADGVLIFSFSNNNSVIGNNITNADHAIFFSDFSSCNVISDNNITENGWGVYSDFSSYNTIYQNIIADNFQGIDLRCSSDSNNIIGNSIAKNDYIGVHLEFSSNTTISQNEIADNEYGAYLENSSNNSFYLNNFVNNTGQVYDSSWTYHTFPSSINFWNDSVEGNYWSNYTGVDSNNDGIGDAPHAIDTNNADYYPLMGMFHSFNTSTGCFVNVISNSTIRDFEYFESDSTIRMHVSNSSETQTIGFCRICIPHKLMNATNIQAIIDNEETTILYPNYTLYDNTTHRWIYFAYEHSTHEIVIVPEFSPSIVVPLFIIATLLAVIGYGRKRTI